MNAFRRRLLAAAPLALAPFGARAFRLEAATPALAADYAASACEAPETHEAIRIALDQLMEGRPVPQEAPPRLSALAHCPFCGCGVAAGAADHGEGAAPRPG
ncbi:MAG: hypothetical protein O9325_11975 [Roseomonas sp.]|nr:hypothetical protein [Roseomonas sp.]